MGARAPAWLAMSLATLAGCGGDDITLSVDLRTDLVPGSEFTQVETTLEVAGVLREAIPAGASAMDDFLVGRRIAEYDELVLGVALVRVALRDSAGALVATRLTRVDIRGDTGLVVIISRDCLGVSCPGAADAPDATECLAGECVPPTCQPSAPETCGEVVCGSCTSSVDCVEAACAGAVCLRVPRDARCGIGERCDEGRGCILDDRPDGGPLPRDGGPPPRDGGPPPRDGGPPPVDAGMPEEGLIAWYSCEDVSGGMADESGNGRYADCVLGCPDSVAPGRVGRACDFRRSESDGMRIDFDSALSPASGFTISLHVRARDGESSLLAKPLGDTSTNSYQLELRDFVTADPAPDVVLFTTSPDGTTWDHIDHYTDFGDTWVHLAGVWTGSNRHLYVDGVREVSGPGTVAYDDSPVLLGYDANSDGTGAWLYYDGLLDDIRIYDRALSETEIADLASP